MSTKRDEYKVGIFAAFGLLLFVVTVPLVGGARGASATKKRLRTGVRSRPGLQARYAVQRTPEPASASAVHSRSGSALVCFSPPLSAMKPVSE